MFQHIVLLVLVAMARALPIPFQFLPISVGLHKRVGPYAREIEAKAEVADRTHLRLYLMLFVLVGRDPIASLRFHWTSRLSLAN